jgi:cytochrome c553
MDTLVYYSITPHRMKKLLLPALLILSAGLSHAAPPAPAHWKLCSTCHGDNGHGNKAIHAPAIAGLPDWYVQRQLEKFQTNIRGAHPDDIEGHLMRPMARALPEKLIPMMSEYVASLPKADTKHTLGGDPEKGKILYNSCIGCHGVNGEGNPALKAPSQAGMNDWYMLAQLKKFKGNIRGNSPKDIEAMSMKPIVALLKDEQAMKDVIAYIQTLPGKVPPTTVDPKPVEEKGEESK